MTSPTRTAGAALAGVLFALVLPTPSAPAATADTAFARWTTTADFAAGTVRGTAVRSNAVQLGAGTLTLRYDDPRVPGGARTYDFGSWTSPWVSTGFDSRTVIPSWSVATPAGTWARVDVRVRDGATVGSWDTVARYAKDTALVKRASGSAQADDLASLAVDTVVARKGTTFRDWQVRVVLYRLRGSNASPTLYSVNGVAASYRTRSAATSATTMTATTELAVPRYSQMIHRGQFPQWGGGGEAWCSPTSTAMVLRFFGKGPSAKEYAFAKRSADPWVAHAARGTYDHAYRGTGNWPFNTAYAGARGLDTFVTRFHDLRDAEAFTRAGIPVMASVAYPRGGLTGAPVSSSAGHLLVVTGFAADGRVITNDPAAAKNSSVRKVYRRDQFEKAWLQGSGGVVYVLRPPGLALPADTARW